eukprot:CAMPEP_0176483410 /NCGR_PEP_ID=MMETSP0200_2-20121128/3902_1 /TAXON_ID=947934 /ORGANISM="Chaetoceros sp., Strain GSL56" /LENGTH=942 /DNA_ID=CAMNT_0017879807 /DNA_START=143 /DNA_END=2974 /DNA_ORIENTATION=-
MEDKENDFKSRPPRLVPSNHGQLLTAPCHSVDYFNPSMDNNDRTSRSRGRSSSTRSNHGSSKGSSSGINSRSYNSKPPTLVTSNHHHKMTNSSESSKVRNGKSRSVDPIHRVTRGAGAPYDECYVHVPPFQVKTAMNDVSASRDNSTSNKRRASDSSSKSSVAYMSVSNTDDYRHSTSHGTNAPKKKIRTHSKQHVIKKQDHIENSDMKHSQRARSQSRSNITSTTTTTQQRRGNDGGKEERVKRSASSSGRIQTYSSDQVRRARSTSKTRGQSIGPTSITGHPPRSGRPVSQSRSSSARNVNRSRSGSFSSVDNTQRRRSISRARSVSSGQFAVEPNVHHNAIVETEIECPVIAEMKENELYAIHNGIDLITETDDFVETSIEDMLLQDENNNESIASVRRNQSRPLPNRPDYPRNASFLCDGEGDSARIIGSRTDIEVLKTVAGQLCVGWGANEYETPSIARRIIDFNFAQMKRRRKFGNERPWGILGLYDHLSAVRMDVEWAEMAACRRANGEPKYMMCLKTVFACQFSFSLHDQINKCAQFFSLMNVCRYKAWFEFVEERSTGKNRPFFTISSLLICTAFLLASISANGWTLEAFSVNPMLGPSAETLVSMGAKESLLIVQNGEVWRIISAMVLHAGLIHFVLNMLALWFVGKAVEQCHGFFPSLLLFVVPGIGGTILSAIFLPNMVSVGASGGIFGLIGACLADIYMNWGLLFNKFVNRKNNHVHIYVLLALLVDVIVNSLIGLTPFVDNFTRKYRLYIRIYNAISDLPLFTNFHRNCSTDLGGMIFGFICGTSTMQRISTDMFDGQEKEKTLWTSAKSHFFHFFGIILTVTIMIASFTILMQGDGVTSPCKSCKVFSCVEFPPWASPSDKWWYCDDCAGVTADARINPETNEFDRLSLNCPYGDIFTLDIQNDMKTDREWLERQLPKWCRAHCDGI